MDGLLLVDKPVGITSFDVIRQLRRRTGVRKIGHAGTLDPLASGLMLMLFGAACKQAERLTKLDKRYVAQVQLGYESTTGDEEGDKTPVSDRVPTRSELEQAMRRQTGPITQVPSAYSAIKINGQEAYKRMRAGETVVMPSRQVTVHECKLLNYEYPWLEFEASVSSGTYIRTLAQDIGRLVGTGAYLSGLRRTQVGDYPLEEAVVLSAIETPVVAQQYLRALV